MSSLTVYGDRSAVCYQGEHVEIMRMVWDVPADIFAVYLTDRTKDWL